MSYTVRIEQFQGPLDVLLQMIEERELEITEISLAEIADAFIGHLDQIEDHYPEELADFLVVATKLLYLKSRELLPFLEPEDNEESASQLADRLRMYKEFRDATDTIIAKISENHFSIPRSVRAAQLEVVEFSPPANVTGEGLARAFQNVIDRMEVVIKIPKAAIRSAITLKDKITALSDLLKQHKELHFNELVGNDADRTEIVVTFLAVLELMKQQSIMAHQTSSYSDIMITRIQ